MLTLDLKLKTHTPESEPSKLQKAERFLIKLEKKPCEEESILS